METANVSLTFITYNAARRLWVWALGQFHVFLPLAILLSFSTIQFIIQQRRTEKYSLSEAPEDSKTITTYGKNVTLSITQVTFNNIIQMEDISGLNITTQTVYTVGFTAECSWGTVKILLPCKFKGLTLTWRNRGTHWDTEHKATEACRDLTTKDELL